MALTMGQVPIAGTMAAFVVPPGPASVSLYAAATGVYVGTGTALTTANGMSLSTTYPVTFTCFPGSQGQQLYATVGTAATTVTINYVVSTAR